MKCQVHLIRKSQHLQGRERTTVTWNQKRPHHVLRVHACRPFLLLALPLEGQRIYEQLRKGKACRTNHTTRTSGPVPPACSAPGSRRGRSGAETGGSWGVSRNPISRELSTPAVPVVEGKASHRVLWRAGRSQPAGSSLCSLLRPAASPPPSPAARAWQVPGGHADTERGR